eukprot:TRINITY_DN51879_c0_g1_i1.p1 TRINITY_DN51879_c0_g1~~TRINITY_DN51879_c0_g1_i1.p1  ORF type:complete len:546 (+),score=157.27 TRINITY_DN51879_c0_g1_i1:87-1640(+)
MRGAAACAAAAAALAAGQPAQPFDPRHQFDKRCPGAFRFDPPGALRDPASTSSYLPVQMNASGTASGCAELCCHDWSCESFLYYAPHSAQSSPCGSQDLPCCVFRDDVDALVNSSSPGISSGVRGLLPARSPPYPNSTALPRATLDPDIFIGVNGDEFPITWGKDGVQYTGAGDNFQKGQQESPLSFFRVAGGPREMGCTNPQPSPATPQPSPVCANISLQGADIPVRGPAAVAACPEWHSGIPNLKSSGVISIDGVLYWAISCFNYGDDAVFNRQRYGPAWIITSADGGVTWNETATPTNMFTGRLAAPRFINYGKDNAGAPDDWVYVYFPGTQDGSAFFENNDQMLLGRVHKRSILSRSAYQFFYGVQLDGTVTWTSDESIARSVWEFPLMTSVQQANWLPTQRRFVFANWAWISYDGHPRPDHTPDERNPRTGHQRTQLTLVEAPHPWGPFSVFYRDDNWRTSDGSVGGYTPVIPPAWVAEDGFWIVFTQCCGNPRPPINHYNFNAQRVRLPCA